AASGSRGTTTRETVRPSRTRWLPKASPIATSGDWLADLGAARIMNEASFFAGVTTAGLGGGLVRRSSHDNCLIGVWVFPHFACWAAFGSVLFQSAIVFSTSRCRFALFDVKSRGAPTCVAHCAALRTSVCGAVSAISITLGGGASQKREAATAVSTLVSPPTRAKLTAAGRGWRWKIWGNRRSGRT